MYKLLIIDDEMDIRKATYDRMLSRQFELICEKSAASPTVFDSLGGPEHDCIVLDMVINDNPGNSDTFKRTLHQIGKKKPIILVSRFFNQIASWLNDISAREYDIIGYFGWEEFVVETDSDAANIIASKILFSLNDYFGRTRSKKDANEKITILHISDLQFGDPDFSDETFLSESTIADKILNAYNCEPDLLVITGDVAYSGLQSEFERAHNWISNFAKNIFPEKLESFNERILLIPGNHDVNLEMSALDIYQFNFDLSDDILKKRKSPLNEHKKYGLSPFCDFAYSITKNKNWIERSNSLCWINDQFLNWGIRFIHLNSVSEMDYAHPKKVEIDHRALTALSGDLKKSKDSIYTIYLCHNGPDDMGYSFGEDCASPCVNLFSFLIYSKGRLFLHGHRHVTSQAYKMQYKDEHIGTTVNYIMSGSLNLNNLAKDERRSFSIIELNRMNGIVNHKEVYHRIFEIRAKTPIQTKHYNIYTGENV